MIKIVGQLISTVQWRGYQTDMGEASPVQVEIPEQLITAMKRATELYRQSIGDSEQKVRCNIPHNELYILRMGPCYVPQCAKKWFIYRQVNKVPCKQNR